MAISKRSLGAVLAAISVLALVVVGETAVGAAPRAKTELSILRWPGGVFGYVRSRKVGRCAAGRKVGVFVRSGKVANPSRDERIGLVRARRHDGSVMWWLRLHGSERRLHGSERVYAYAAGTTTGCAGARTANVHLLPQHAEVRTCPFGEVCSFNLHFDTGIFRYCPNFSSPSATCQGTATGPGWAVANYDPPHEFAVFAWKRGASGDIETSYRGIVGVLNSALNGKVPNPGSAKFSVTSAHPYQSFGSSHWFTPDVPGVKPGDMGGPLYINFKNGKIGIDVYLHGYLYRKK